MVYSPIAMGGHQEVGRARTALWSDREASCTRGKAMGFWPVIPAHWAQSNGRITACYREKDGHLGVEARLVLVGLMGGWPMTVGVYHL